MNGLECFNIDLSGMAEMVRRTGFRFSSLAGESTNWDNESLPFQPVFIQ